MRMFLLLAMTGLTMTMPARAGAQVFRTETPPPAVTAASDSWQLNGEPIFYAGAFYLPSGTDAFFDGKVMVRTGVYEGVPLYEDATLQPYSVVYVPVGGVIMRPYVRQETDPRYIPGTSSRPQVRGGNVDSRITVPAGYALVPMSSLRALRDRSSATPDEAFQPVGVVMISPGASRGTVPNAAAALPGAWIEFQNARWFSAGRALEYDATRFEPAGEYRGFPVYRERSGFANRIFVTVVRNGPVAPFERR